MTDSEVTETIARRTPGFSGWQQEHWLYHCNDGAAFLGRAGSEELEHHPDAVEMLRSEGQESGWDADQIAGYIGALDKEARRRRICSVADTAAPTSRTPISASRLSRS